MTTSLITREAQVMQYSGQPRLNVSSFDSLPVFQRLGFCDDYLTKRIELHKWLRSERAGKDIGVDAAVVDYFTDNPSQLLNLFPGLKGPLNNRQPVKCDCYGEIERVRGILLPIAIAEHKSLMHHSNESAISDEAALEDFRKKGFFNDWLKRETFAAYLTLCENAEYHSSFQLAYRDLLNKQNQGLPLIQVLPNSVPYANKDNYKQFLGCSCKKNGLEFLLHFL